MLQVGPDATSGIVLVVSEPGASRQLCVASSIRDTCRRACNACCRGDVADFGYLPTVEQAGIAGIDWRFIALRESLVNAASPCTETGMQGLPAASRRRYPDPCGEPVHLRESILLLQIAGSGLIMAGALPIGTAPRQASLESVRRSAPNHFRLAAPVSPPRSP
jgi:hypothetical protein